MKKIICCSILFCVMFWALTAGAVASADVIGSLNISDANESYIDIYRNLIFAQVLDKDFRTEGTMINFYDSLTLLQLALSKGEIDAITTPEIVGEYMLRTNPAYKLRAFMITKLPTAVAFGFMKEKKELCERFSKAIQEMEQEGVIGILARDFITGPKAINPPTISFEEFDGAETINVALTGDMPPIDYIADDGKPAGFNTAILAEIGKRLRVNIRLVFVESGSRALALKSERADVVFWFQVFEGYDKQPDVPEGVITSTPYFGWNKAMLIGRK